MKTLLTYLAIVILLTGCELPENIFEEESKPNKKNTEKSEPEPITTHEEEPDTIPDPEPLPENYPLKGVWQNEGDPNLIFTFGESTGGEESCEMSFDWAHLNYTTGTEFGAGQIRLTKLHANTSPDYCWHPEGYQERECSWVQLNEEGTEMQLGCLWKAPPFSSNVWIRIE